MGMGSRPRTLFLNHLRSNLSLFHLSLSLQALLNVSVDAVFDKINCEVGACLKLSGHFNWGSVGKMVLKDV